MARRKASAGIRELVLPSRELAKSSARDGLLMRGEDDDGRRTLVRITPKGERALLKALPLWREAQGRALSELRR